MSDKSSATTKRFRKSFSKIKKVIDIPDLMGMQKRAYTRFLQMDVPPDKREDIGLQAVFHSVLPIKDFSGTASLEFVRYTFGQLKYDVEECIQRGMTYEIPIRITVRLVVYAVDKETGSSSIRDIKEQEIYFGTIPLMTGKGTFIINGTERVVVSQLHRSPGVFFDHDKGKAHPGGKVIYSARIIPLRGSWIDMEIDTKDIVHIRIDRRRKFPVTLLLKALGYSTEDILNYFYRKETVLINGDSLSKVFDTEIGVGEQVSKDVQDPKTGKVIIKKGKKITRRVMRDLEKAKIEAIPIEPGSVYGKVLADAVTDPTTGEEIAGINEVVDEEIIERIKAAKIPSIELLFIDNIHTSDSVRKTLLLDKVNNQDEAVVEIYRRLRPSNPPTIEMAYDFCNKLFFNPTYYDLSKVGRLKMNLRLEQEVPIEVQTLRKEDILLTTKTLVTLKDTQGPVDDIDHLGDRRVRTVGELLEIQYRTGLVRMERAVKERMSLQEIEALMPHDLINSKPVSAVLKEFFGTSQLSQFMDQTNPLSEITHKRRLSALGPGGLTRERAGFEVRDVHPTHYGRICPIETPEGPNIGLIVSLGTYANVNDYGFIETPYNLVKDGRVSRKTRFLNALEEKDHPIAQANAPLTGNRRFKNPMVSARVAGEFMMVNREEVKFMDVSPNQLVSISASLIPFLENDDANRALMGSNMQRQAVPLLTNSAPLIGTGMEKVVAKDSGVTVIAKEDGKVMDVGASRIVLRYDSAEGDGTKPKVEICKLNKFNRSNQNTCFNHKPIVRKGDSVKKGDIIADGPATEKGELALGKNIMVAFMPWGGYNFEDSILISERLSKKGVFTSVHIEEFDTVARDTKLGKEEITRDIPNVGEDALKDLDESGIIRIGAEVGSGDVLVGKITPKGETQLSPEEKLLRAIFGEKAGDVKDTSLRVPPGISGIVIDAKVFSRKGVEQDSRAKSVENAEIARLEKDRKDELKIIEESIRERLKELLAGQKCGASIKNDRGNIVVKKGAKLTPSDIDSIPLQKWGRVVLPDDDIAEKVSKLLDGYKEQVDLVKMVFEKKLSRLRKGDELPPGVIKLVKVYVAMKRKLSVGDKMAGRHGNKGVVSRILPEEDMPYFEDGTPVDMVLNPLGVPSRMNVGQVLEIHLGWAAWGLGRQLDNLLENTEYELIRKKLKRIFTTKSMQAMIGDMDDEELKNLALYYRNGVHLATSVFDGATEKEVETLLKDAGLPSAGQATLYDGRTGETFDNKVTVGIMYMLKLHHLVADKIHARSIGPYSLVTQQPLGGKAQFGGQRLGEMEVWSMEGYGAAYALQEFLTVKSDDVAGRTRMYEKIVKGDNTLEPGLPESFNVLIKELQSLGLDVQLEEKEK